MARDAGFRKLRVALCSWEIGRAGTGFGVKVGGLGAVIEELPVELCRAAALQGVDLELEILSPCFAHYDRGRLRRLPLGLPAVIEGHRFEFEAYERAVREASPSPDAPRSFKLKFVYFWDPGQLGWTHAGAVYPHDPRVGLKLYSAVGQAMAGYIRRGDFQTIHLHDHHVGLVPFFLDDGFLGRVPVHLTVHNAGYQGVSWLEGGGYATLDRAGLPGERLFHKYFDFLDSVNILKACIVRVNETGGRVTTVSGDLDATWGYAAELRESHASLAAKARRLTGRPPGEVFLANRRLDVFEKIPVAGITNGLAGRNRPECMPELAAAHLAAVLARLKIERGESARLFSSAEVEREMLSRDHFFDARRLEVKYELKRLLHLEAFGRPIHGYPAIFGVVGRLADQKNIGLVADVAERVLAQDGAARFVILGSAPADDHAARALETRLRDLAGREPGRIWFGNAFSGPLSRLILAGSDFTLVPSRFEPCGLVDYEAALLGTIPVCRATGGLAKVRHCGYLYEWHDAADRQGEAGAFLDKIMKALRVFRGDYPAHVALMAKAMATDASWERPAARYVELYRYGLLSRRWHAGSKDDPAAFAAGLGADRALFSRFFAPAEGDYGDPRDRALQGVLADLAPAP